MEGHLVNFSNASGMQEQVTGAVPSLPGQGAHKTNQYAGGACLLLTLKAGARHRSHAQLSLRSVGGDNYGYARRRRAVKVIGGRVLRPPASARVPRMARPCWPGLRTHDIGIETSAKRMPTTHNTYLQQIQLPPATSMAKCDFIISPGYTCTSGSWSQATGHLELHG